MVKILGVGILGAVLGCSGVQSPLESSIDKKVLADIEAGDGLPQIEADVEALVVASGVVGADIVYITNGILTVLVGLGYVPATWLPAAKGFLAQTSATIAARKIP